MDLNFSIDKMKCMVIFCKNKGNIPGMTYFMLTPRRHDTWMRALGRDPNIEHLCEKNSVCYVHFRKEDMYVINNKIRLKPDAFPQLNLRKPFLPTFQTIKRSFRSDHRPIIKRSDTKLPVQRQHMGSTKLGTILQKCPPLTLPHMYSTFKDMNSKWYYKSCAVPQCNSTWKTSPNKLFVYVPHMKTIRYKWLKLAGRDPTSISLNSTMYFCEDHFDMPNDMENYMEYHLMGSVSQIRMRPGCMPTRYQCQTYDAPERSYILKKQRRALIAERGKYSKDRTVATKRDNSYGSSGPSTSHVNMPLALSTRVTEKRPDSHQLSTISGQTPLQLGYATPGKEKSMLTVKKLGKMDNKEMNSEPNSVDVPKKPVVQSVELIPETSCQKPDGYLPDCTPSSSQSEVIATNSSTEKRNHNGEVFCRMCLEPITESKTMVPLTILDINFATESAIDKQKKIIQTYKITNMIEIIMPNFDFNAAYNPMACHKCVSRVESAYSFIQGCIENEKIIKLYKSRHCPNEKSVSCEDVAQSLLMKERKRKTPKKGDSTESASDSLLEQRENSELASDVSQAERPENVNTTSVSQENLTTETSIELCSSIKCETEDTGDYGDYGGDPHFPVKTDEMSCIFKEEYAEKEEIAVEEEIAVREEMAVEKEIFIKEEMSWDFTDITNNEPTAQLDMDYHVKEEYCLRPDDLELTDIVNY